MGRMKIEDVLKRSIGKEVRLCLETGDGGDSFVISGDLLEVTDDYIRVRGIACCDIYINRKSTVITYFEVFGGKHEK